jgi:predicted metal-binding membrane protein
MGTQREERPVRALRLFWLNERRVYVLTVLALAVVASAAWAVLVLAVWDVDGPAGHVLMPMGGDAWSAGVLVSAFAMWSVMMAAMMIPSATPILGLFASMERDRGGFVAQRVSAFACGYALAWILFSAAAAVAQAALREASFISPMLGSTDRLFSAAVLVAAGIYQWTPLKRTCLRRCRTPLGFLLTQWRDGRSGAVAMGARHGLFCVGCCWLLMAMLFVVGVMNLLWVAALTTVVIAEKTLPQGEWISRIAGVGLGALGALALRSGT